MAITHEYRIEGNINGSRVLGVGEGRIDPSEGISEMEVHFEHLPEGWDPRTIVLMCCDRSVVMGSLEEDGAIGMRTASGGYVSIGRHLNGVTRRGVLRDEQGQLLADVQASSITDLRGKRRIDHSRIEGGFSKLRPGSTGVKEIKPFSAVMMQAGPSVITVTSSYALITEDDRLIHGFTFYPHYLPEQVVALPGIQTLVVREISQVLSGRDLYTRTVSAVRPLAPSVDLSRVIRLAA